LSGRRIIEKIKKTIFKSEIFLKLSKKGEKLSIFANFQLKNKMQATKITHRKDLLVSFIDIFNKYLQVLERKGTKTCRYNKLF